MTDAFPLKWPLGWPRTEQHRRSRNSHFRNGFDDARRKLYRELALLGVKSDTVVLSSNIPLRNDGHPRAGWSPRAGEDLGIAVYFTYKKRPMTMARDAYDNLRDNLLSIVHAISHLRGLERHGGGTMMDRAFEGFAALPAGKSHWETLGLDPKSLGRGATSIVEEIKTAFRKLAMEASQKDASQKDVDMAMLVQARDLAIAEVSK